MLYHPQETPIAISQFSSWLDGEENDPLSVDRGRPGGEMFPTPEPGDRVTIVSVRDDQATVRFETGVRAGKTHEWPTEWLKPITPP
jgi:hypothetical protein